ALEEAGGRLKRRRVARAQPQPEPQGDPEPEPEDIDVVESVAEDIDGEELGEADFQEAEDTVEEAVGGKKGKKLEGPSWT
ncbi:hypothetical protein A2U01_0089316, partial [Trifolium medium]|nr:hypothetical protein [Trifolium medium]